MRRTSVETRRRIASLIFHARRERGLTIGGAARRIGIPPSTLARYERGASSLRGEALVEILWYYRIPLLSVVETGSSEPSTNAAPLLADLASAEEFLGLCRCLLQFPPDFRRGLLESLLSFVRSQAPDVRHGGRPWTP